MRHVHVACARDVSCLPGGTSIFHPTARPHSNGMFHPTALPERCRWYNSEDEATLRSGARTALDMREYICEVVDGPNLILALLPAALPARKSWYLRAVDSEAFEAWRWALGAAGAAGTAGITGRPGSVVPVFGPTPTTAL